MIILAILYNFYSLHTLLYLKMQTNLIHILYKLPKSKINSLQFIFQPLFDQFFAIDRLLFHHRHCICVVLLFFTALMS